MQRSGVRSQMGPAVGGDPYVHSVSVTDGWLKVGLKRGLAELPQQVHVVCVFAGGSDHVIHESIDFPKQTKRVTVRFKPSVEDTTVEFEPVVQVSDTYSRRTIDSTEGTTPAWIELRVLNAARTSQEFDSVAAQIETRNGELSITELDDNRSLSGGSL